MCISQEKYNRLLKENESLKNENKLLKEDLNSIKYGNWSNRQTFEAYCLITDNEDPERMEELKEEFQYENFGVIWDFVEDCFEDRFINYLCNIREDEKYNFLWCFFSQLKTKEIATQLEKRIKGES